VAGSVSTPAHRDEAAMKWGTERVEWAPLPTKSATKLIAWRSRLQRPQNLLPAARRPLTDILDRLDLL